MSGSFAPPVTVNQVGDSSYTTPTLLNSYTVIPGYTPGYKKFGNGLVICRGIIQKTNPVAGEALFNLPVSYRPTGNTIIKICNLFDSPASQFRSGTLNISASTGDVSVSFTFSTTLLYVYLADLIFEAL